MFTDFLSEFSRMLLGRWRSCESGNPPFQPHKMNDHICNFVKYMQADVHHWDTVKWCKWATSLKYYSSLQLWTVSQTWIESPSFKVRSHGAICSACNSSFIHVFLWNCSHDAMGLDVICNVLTLESHITITQNRYGNHSCVTSHTSMHHMQSKTHHVNSVINNHTIQFLYLKNRSRTSHHVNETLQLHDFLQAVNIWPFCPLIKDNVESNA